MKEALVLRIKNELKGYILLFMVLSVVYFFASLYFIDIHTQNYNNCKFLIMLFSWLGFFQLFFTLSSIKRNFGSYISLYSIFYMFLFIFSYGQFIMWALGFHYDAEMTVSRHVRFIDENTVVRIQVMSLHLLSIFHLFALFAFGKNNSIKNEVQDVVFRDISRLIATPMIIVSFVINLYVSIVSFGTAANNGYLATFDINLPVLLKYFSYMFIPAIFLNLIVHNFSKKSFFILSGIFLIYAIPLAIAGDRGSWIYFLGPWLWCYFFRVDIQKQVMTPDKYKWQRKKKIFRMLIIVLTALYVSSVFVSVRDVGYSVLVKEDFEFTWESLYKPFVKPFFEMGQSARILGIIIQDGLDKTYNYGNTFIADVLGMTLSSVKTWFGYPEWYVENWMSSDYLGMVNYGVGFSSFAEAYLNGGVYFSWFYMAIFGWFIGSLLNVSSVPGQSSSKRVFVALSATSVLGPSVRATLDFWLRQFFWGVLLLLLVCWGIGIFAKESISTRVARY
uniref:Wzy n=1 Tax=Streptococcus suis TaxID=1307 RepID=A0A0F6S2U8_STRSU|nr:wzy [Streptococcus suis]AKE79702.1 wzy [Streptococcus suis]AKE80001.1 wzy [Streptococcus suis]AKE80362.1 wzy [Streptococcus suis]ANT96583.1 Wzy [Streptococcus suis]